MYVSKTVRTSPFHVSHLLFFVNYFVLSINQVFQPLIKEWIIKYTLLNDSNQLHDLRLCACVYMSLCESVFKFPNQLHQDSCIFQISKTKQNSTNNQITCMNYLITKQKWFHTHIHSLIYSGTRSDSVTYERTCCRRHTNIFGFYVNWNAIKRMYVWADETKLKPNEISSTGLILFMRKVKESSVSCDVHKRVNHENGTEFGN